MAGGSDRAGADQLASPLMPRSATADEHPGRASVGVVGRSAHEGGVAATGQRDGETLAQDCFRFADTPTSMSPCWLHAPPLRVNTHTAPLLMCTVVFVSDVSSPGPPTIAVLPSPDSATEKPCWEVTPLGSTSLPPCCVHSRR